MNRKEVCQLRAEALQSEEVHGTNRKKKKLLCPTLIYKACLLKNLNDCAA